VRRRCATVAQLVFRWELANYRRVGAAAMKTLVMLCVGILATAVAAQETPAISLAKVNRYADGSCGAVLIDGEGRTPFHLGLNKYRCDLFVGATHEEDAAAKQLAPGSDAEAALLQRLMAWAEASFGPQERATIEAADDVHHRGSGWTFDRYKEAAVVNRLAHYRQIRGAEITDVFEGRSTVALSFKVRDGLGNQRLVLFRKLADGLVRPHLGDSMTPVAEESREERWILQAMLSYSQKNVPKVIRDLLWSGVKVKAKDVTVAAMHVVSVMIQYRKCTSPRVANTWNLLDGGSMVYAMVDARGQPFEVEFDKEIRSTTIGRMKFRNANTSDELVAFGSAREQQLLAGFDTCLKRASEEDRDVLQNLLARYRELRKAARK
tara:strand:+ start:49036 stop:50172 length:1137 start_codon:yes stop_codon:yes gene_type:complete